MAAATGTGKRLTPDEKDEIVERIFNGESYRDIAKAVGVQTKTVQNTFRAWKRGPGAKRVEAQLEMQAELVARQERIAIDARRDAAAARQAEDRAAVARFLAEERQALKEVGRLAGAEAPDRVEHSGSVELTSPLDELLGALDRIAPSAPADTDDDTDATDEA
jgi:transposase